MNLADIIDRHAGFWPGKAALRFGGETLSYAALAERIDRAARWLSVECGVGQGERVAVLAHNHPDTLVLLYACARLGAILAPLNWRLAAAEQLYIWVIARRRFSSSSRPSGTSPGRSRRRSPRPGWWRWRTF
jgi:fatty-acyl-CoA synthase